MIVPFEQWVGTATASRPDVCIVGGGAAGLEVAAQLVSTRRRVLVLEGGAARGLDPRAQRLQRVRATSQPLRLDAGPQTPSRTALARAVATPVLPRVLGGSMTAWSGRWHMPAGSEFELRPWMGAAHWPVRWSEFERFAHEVARDRHLPGGGAAPVRTSGEVGALGLERLAVMQPIEPHDAVGEVVSKLAAASNVVVVTGANVLELLPAPGGATVGEVTVRGVDGAALRMAAEVFVVAAGAIETARLLLLSTRFGGCGPGNRHGHVGRGFMERPLVRLGRLFPSREAASAGLLERATARGWASLPCFALTGPRAAELQLPHHVLELRALEERSAMQRLVHGPAVHELRLHIEQRPDASNRVELDAERDELGVPIARVHWQPTPADEDGVRRFAAMLGSVLAPRMGRIDVDEAALTTASWIAQGHHAGTARMAASSTEGVVDCDGRVFGVGNLYVAGPAVFPVGIGAEPMLLTYALVRRLARHLAQ